MKKFLLIFLVVLFLTHISKAQPVLVAVNDGNIISFTN